MIFPFLFPASVYLICRFSPLDGGFTMPWWYHFFPWRPYCVSMWWALMCCKGLLQERASYPGCGIKRQPLSLRPFMNYFSSREPPYAKGHLSSQVDPQPVINACRKIKFWPCKSKQDSLRHHASSTTSLEVFLGYIEPQVLPVFSCFLHHSFSERVRECTFLTSCILNICLLPMESKVLYYSEEWGKKWLAMRSSLLAAGEQVAPDIRWCSSC